MRAKNLHTLGKRHVNVKVFTGIYCNKDRYLWIVVMGLD